MSVNVRFAQKFRAHRRGRQHPMPTRLRGRSYRESFDLGSESGDYRVPSL